MLWLIFIVIKLAAAGSTILQMVFLSGTQDSVSGPDVVGTVPAVLNGWKSTISGAEWIWDVVQVPDPSLCQSCIFTRNFAIDGTPISAILYAAADDIFSLTANNAPTNAFTTNYYGLSPIAYDITSYIQPFKNTLIFNVTNLGGGAGLIYSLVVRYKVLADSGFL
jgi:hypothetical protein